MSSVFRISEAASLALHSMVLLAANADRLLSTMEIAAALHASGAHLTKVFQRLTRVGFVKSVRGRKGGFLLGRDAVQISLLDIYEAIEGPLVPTECLLDAPICGGKCILGGLLKKVNTQVRDHLSKTRLSEFAVLPSKVKSWRMKTS